MMFRFGTSFLAVLLLCGFPLLATSAEVSDAPCYECHDELRESFSQGRTHPPVEEGDCEACHEDHGDEEKLMLSDEVPALCFNCHDEFSGAHKHDPVAEGDCVSCHNPHHSEQPSLLVEAMPDLCYQCHDDYSQGRSVHDPVAEGSCTECHGVHQSEREALLTARYDRKLRVVFSEEAYELCLGCHELEAFSESVTVDGTAFRYGARNLHYVHLFGEQQENEYGIKKRRKRRISCSGCHLPHFSEQAKLIRSDRDRGKMTVFTIDYRQTKDGGGCVVGCHKPYQYVRDGGGAADRPAQLTAPADKGTKAPKL